jgi:hypothetical protein
MWDIWSYPLDKLRRACDNGTRASVGRENTFQRAFINAGKHFQSENECKKLLAKTLDRKQRVCDNDNRADEIAQTEP